jgi:hypothetical protein
MEVISLFSSNMAQPKFEFFHFPLIGVRQRSDLVAAKRDGI